MRAREEAVEVCLLLLQAGPSTDRSTGSHPRAGVREARPSAAPVEEAGHEQAEPSFSLGRPGGRRLSQPLLVWAGPLREPVEPCGRPRRVISARAACSSSGPHSEGRTSLGEWLWGPGSSAGPLPPRRLRCRTPRICWGWSIDLPALSSRVAVSSGGRVAWAGVLAASATPSKEPCMSALCVQVLI